MSKRKVATPKAVGIQVTRPLLELTVHQSVSTSGGEGTSLARGEQEIDD
jgi:hypothetical protein